tara:strand:- start:1397 stop:1564 length:168 start_codon:yes stop_codon:yes gene_type:complete
MSDFRTIEEFQRHQEENAIPKLRWWQVQALAADFPNNQEFGAEVRKLIKRTENTK